MSRGRKIVLIIGIFALFMGGIGCLVYVLVRQQQPVTDYYTRRTAIDMLNYIQTADVADLGYEADGPEMSKGITAGDAKRLLQQYLGEQDQTAVEASIEFLYKLREKQVLSRQEFQSVYEYIMMQSGTDQVKV